MGWHAERADLNYWERTHDYHGTAPRNGIDLGAAIEEDLIMGYLNRDNGYQPTGQVNSQPVRGEVDGQPVSDPGSYPAPEPAHVRDGVTTVALDLARGQAETGRRAAEARLRDTQRRLQGVTEELAKAQAELARLELVLGFGPYVIVKLPNGWFEGDQPPVTQPVEVRVGFGGGVTRHLLQPVLSLGQQAVAEEDARRASQRPPGQVRAVLGEQEATVRLPAQKPQEALADWPDPEARPTY
jgi:hypothetical protein